MKWRLAPSNAPPADVSLVMVITCDVSDETHRNRFAPAAGSSSAPAIGTAITAVGCPFGVTAPQHFSELQYIGVISQVVQVSADQSLVDSHLQHISTCMRISCTNASCPLFAWKQDAGKAGLLLADFRALPGMEGSPVYDGSGALVGMVVTPLCISGYELPLILPVMALDAAVSASLPEAPSVGRHPAYGTAAIAATATHREPKCCSPHQRRQQETRSQPKEPAVQLERGACSAAAATMAATAASPVVNAPGTPAQAATALLVKATRGVVGCSLSTGQWASGILVNR